MQDIYITGGAMTPLRPPHRRAGARAGAAGDPARRMDDAGVRAGRHPGDLLRQRARRHDPRPAHRARPRLRRHPGLQRRERLRQRRHRRAPGAPRAAGRSSTTPCWCSASSSSPRSAAAPSRCSATTTRPSSTPRPAWCCPPCTRCAARASCTSATRTPADLAAVAVKNRHHGTLNEYAQQRSEVTVDEVLASRMIADPLTLLQCCPSQVDGAAAVVLSTRRAGAGKPVQGAVVGGASRACASAADDDILDAEITARAARQAYEQAGLGPKDVDVVELHDAFTIAELLYYEALGLAAHGEAVPLLQVRRHAARRPRAGQPERRPAGQGPSAGRHRRRADGRGDVAPAGPRRRAPGRQAPHRPDAMHRRRHRRRRPRRVFRPPAGSLT